MSRVELGGGAAPKRSEGRKRYLGDAVYAELDRWNNVVLTTEDGIQATNRIVLERQTLAALLQFIGGGR